MMKKLIVFWLTFLQVTTAQNLIPNPSFEKARPEPSQRLTDFNNFTCYNWTRVETPDYFTSQRKEFYGYALTNDGGTQKPLSGEAYVGLMTYGPGSSISECIQVRLNQKLIKNSSYCLSFYVNMRDKSSYAVNEFDYLLSKDSLSVLKGSRIISKDYKRILSDSFIVEKENWVQLCSFYTAKGGEQFLILGNLNENILAKDLYDKFTNRKIIGAYYFIDSVSLFKVNTEIECQCNFRTIEPDKALILRNINFKANEAILLPSSFKELDSLAIYLKKNPKYKIKIFGHTDNSGAEAENIKLSTSRAKAVADYLIQKGIGSNSISFEGLGSSKPLKENSTEKNKSANRRVEFLIIK
jgi:outer membrane protein OmpA-like peptidoglycan-associated protein